MSVSATASRRDSVRGIASVARLVEFAQAAGCDARRSLQGSGIPLSALADPAAEVTLGQELSVVTNLVAALGDRAGLGLEAGSLYGLGTYGIFGFAILSSSTLGEAVSVAERYRELAYALVDVHTEAAGPELLVVLEDGELPAAIRRFGVERDAAAIALLLGELIDARPALGRVSFTFPAPRSQVELDRYVAMFGVVPEFGAERTVLGLDAAALAQPLPRASGFAAAQCLAQCEALLDQRQRRLGAAGEVRAALLADPRALASQTQVAAALGVSVRTLRRRLAAEGTGFRAIASETRQLLAQELLETGQLSVEQVADRLGYADAPSFVHAFTRWTGVPPGRWKRRVAGRRA